MARVAIGSKLCRPVLTALQLPPPLVLLYTPANRVPTTYSVAGVWESIAREDTPRSGRPVLTALQFPPPLVLLKTPPPAVPAYSMAGVMGSIASATIPPTPGPLLVQELIPPSAVILLVTNKAPARTPRLARPNFLSSIFTPDQKFSEMSDISRPNSN